MDAESCSYNRFRGSRRRKENMDRFIPNRSAMNMAFAHYMVTEGSKIEKEEDLATMRPARRAYREILAEALDMNRTRILAFTDKPPKRFPHDYLGSNVPDPTYPHRKIPEYSYRTLDAPGIVDDFFLNLLDWGSNNVLSIALGDTVYLWNASNDAISELVTVDGEIGPVTSVSWIPDEHYIAVGLNNSEVQLWDYATNQKVRTLRDGHSARVGSLAWNNHILTTGGADGNIINNDVRIASPVVEHYRGHHGEVCGLKWSSSGRQLASGGNDSLLHIWDRSMASSTSANQWLHRLEGHGSAIKALAWCPFQSSLLASGSGRDDRCIKFWHSQTGACLNSIDTGSQVCGLLWSKTDKELLSSHGSGQNQLNLWKYPSMVKMAEPKGHTSRILSMAQSPDGCTVATAGTDERLNFWRVFRAPKVAKTAAKSNPEPFPDAFRIR